MKKINSMANWFKLSLRIALIKAAPFYWIGNFWLHKCMQISQEKETAVQLWKQKLCEKQQSVHQLKVYPFVYPLTLSQIVF